ncbi:MAG: HlyD family secretion protein, partial [Rhizobium sp.]|nr:HlyD family secretion protein [Rhizobium sp.]
AASVMGARRRGRGLRSACHLVRSVSHVLLPFLSEIALATVSENRAQTQLVSPGAPLLDIVPVDDVWLVANFKETQVADIQPGQQVSIFIDGYPGRTFEGVVDSLAPGSGSAFSLLPSDNATGNFVRVVQRVPVKIRLVNNPLPGRIVPGLSARIEVKQGSGS